MTILLNLGANNDDVRYLCARLTVTVRLAGDNRSQNAGRLEIYYNATWGTVCNRGFDHTDAQVACSMLGYGYV